jgi:hypothetical protein
VSFFFDSVDPVRAPAIPADFAEEPAEAFQSDPLRRPETPELVAAYFAIEDTAVRRRASRSGKGPCRRGQAGSKAIARNRRDEAVRIALDAAAFDSRGRE